MRQRNLVLSLLLILALVTVVAGCKKPPPEITPEPEPEVTYEPPPPPPPKVEVKDPDAGKAFVDPPLDPVEELARLNRSLRTIYFAFDSSDLSESARSTLRQNAELLKAHADAGVVVEGHCDERGTIEYNLALGERRASSVRDYLVNLGVARPRIRVITYGEERPAAQGHNESAWSQNRRAAFKAE